MSIRIDITWDFISPSFQMATGVLTITSLDQPFYQKESKVLIKCRCKIEQGSKGYSALSEDQAIPSNLFEVFRERVDLMMESYHRGMMLNKFQYSWIDETLDDSVNDEDWLKEKQEQKNI